MKERNERVLIPAISISIAILGGVYYASPLHNITSRYTYAETQSTGGVVIATNPATAQDSDVVRITDANIKIRVKEVLGNTSMSDDEITFGKVKNLTNINRPGTTALGLVSSVSSLEGLQFFTSLESFGVLSGNVTDLSPIANLTSLKRLTIGKMPALTDASQLRNLSNMEFLRIYRNNIQDFSFTEGMPHLKVFVADYNSTPIENLNFLKNNTNLEVLDIEGNGVSDISALENLEKLTHIKLKSNKISDFSPLRNPSQYLSTPHPETVNGSLSSIVGFIDSQTVQTSTTSKIFKNILKDEDSNPIPITEANGVKNVDAQGNPNKNGGYIQLSTQSGVGSTQVTYSKTIQITGANRNIAGTLTIDYNLETDPPVFNETQPSKIVARKGTSIEAKIAEITATDAGSGLSGLVVNNTTAINLNPSNPVAGKYTLTYTATDNYGNSATLNREVEIVDADELQAKLTEARNINTNGYTQESVAESIRVKDAAQRVFDNSSATQQEIDSAEDQLQAAIDGLRTDKQPLQTLVDSLPQQPLYVQEDADVVAELAEANTILAKDNPSVREVTDAQNALQKAIDNAKKSRRRSPE